jgi:uncharacterized protein YfdQ (DUF2303 family)
MPSDTIKDPSIHDIVVLADKANTPNIIKVDAPLDLELGERLLVAHGKDVILTDLTDKLIATRPTPVARTGEVVTKTVASFVAFVNRYKEGDRTVIFADPATMKMTAVFDYHDPLHVDEDFTADALPKMTSAISPRWGRFRASFAFPKSRQYKTWTEQDGKPMSQGDFARFLEDNATDIVDPAVIDPSSDTQMLSAVTLLGLRLAGPNEMLTVSRGLSLKSDERIVNAVNINTGEVQISYQQEHTMEKTELTVPTGFVLAMPIFDGGEWFKLLVRLRYRKIESQIKWFFQVFQLQIAFENAFRDQCTAILLATSTPLFSAEAPATR